MLPRLLEKILLVTGAVGILGIIFFGSSVRFSSMAELAGLNSSTATVGMVVSIVLFFGSAFIVGRDLAAREDASPE